MNLTHLTIKETADLLEAGKTTSLEVTDAYLARIEQLNPKLNAYLTVFPETAHEQAKASDLRRQNGKSRGVLDGIPLAIKDNFSTKGQRTTAASKILEDHEPLYDATAIKKLKAAGVVILGKTNLDQFAMGSSTETSAFGNTLNPWDTDRVPGGSSGGSAVAVAANLCAGALGSDTFGSIRLPAGFCAIVGLKPTYGLISRYGLIAMASSLDVVGPMTKSIEDAEILLDAMVGHDQYDATTLNEPRTKNQPLPAGDQPLNGKKIGMPKEYFGEGMDERVAKTISASIEKLKNLGAEIVEVSLPNTPLAVAAYYTLCPVEVASNMARYDGIRFGSSLEGHEDVKNLLDVYKKSRAEFIGPEVKRRIMLGTYASSSGYYEAYYLKAMKVRALIKQEMDAILEKVDCLVTPVSPNIPFKFGENTDNPLAMYLEDVNVGPVNLAGVPAVTLPCGLIEEAGKKLPVGLQFIGPRLGEDTILQIGMALEKSIDRDQFIINDDLIS